MAILQLNPYVLLTSVAALTNHLSAWYTDNAPLNDAQVAAHFSTKRPILGLCLKRYSFTPDGKAIRLDTRIDIPVEIAVPHFIQDDKIEDNGGLNSNFKLSLQAAVCHRGDSVDSGHYIALVRGSAVPGSPDERSQTTKVWMRFDDLAPSRITVVDIEQALKTETPYLLFYQIVPIEGDPGSITTGEESLSTVHERNASVSEVSSISALTDNSIPERPSFEIGVRDELEPRGRSPAESTEPTEPTEPKRASVISFQEPPPETANGVNTTQKDSLTVPGSEDRTSTPRPKSVSRSQSKSSESGLGRTLSKLRRKSREVSPLPPDLLKQAEVRVTEIKEPSVPALAPAAPQQQLVLHNGSQTTPRPTTLQVNPQPHKTHKREKSRGRASRSKVRGEKPDRECIVM